MIEPQVSTGSWLQVGTESRSAGKAYFSAASTSAATEPEAGDGSARRVTDSDDGLTQLSASRSARQPIVFCPSIDSRRMSAWPAC